MILFVYVSYVRTGLEVKNLLSKEIKLSSVVADSIDNAFFSTVDDSDKTFSALLTTARKAF